MQARLALFLIYNSLYGYNMNKFLVTAAISVCAAFAWAAPADTAAVDTFRFTTTKERIFCMIAYMPKATVQAAIGSIPLALGLSCGKIVLTVAVLAILITAPLGAFGVDVSYKKLLLGAESDERDKTEV